MRHDCKIQSAPTAETPPAVEVGDFIRQVVLPAGNIEMALSRYLDEEGSRLDTTTRCMLAGARDGIREIAESGIQIAAQHLVGANDR